MRFTITHKKKLIWSNNRSMLKRFRKWTMQLLKKYILLIKGMKLLFSLFYVFKNVSSSISHKYFVFPKFRNFSKKFYNTFNCLWTDFEKNLWMLTLRRHIFYIKWSMTSKVIQCHIRWLFYSKINFFSIFFGSFMLLIDWSNNCRLTFWRTKRGCVAFLLSDYLI